MLLKQRRNRVGHDGVRAVGLLIALELTGQQQGRVHHRQCGIQNKITGQFGRLQYFHDGGGQGQAGGFNQYMIHIGTALGDGLHGWDKALVAAVGDEAVGKIVYPDLVSANSLVAAISTVADERAINRHFAELIDQDREAPGLPTFNQTAQQGCFAGSKETGDDGDRDTGGWNQRGHDLISHACNCCMTPSKLEVR